MHQGFLGRPSVLLDARFCCHLGHDKTVHPFDDADNVAALSLLRGRIELLAAVWVVDCFLKLLGLVVAGIMVSNLRRHLLRRPSCPRVRVFLRWQRLHLCCCPLVSALIRWQRLRRCCRRVRSRERRSRFRACPRW